MVEILDVGADAETCLMAGRGMNGLRGTIVCFNASNQRYTLELESGEMMSLRSRNVKAARSSDEVVAEEVVVETIKEEEEESMEYPTMETPTKKKPAPSALPKFPKKPEYEDHEEDFKKDATKKNEGNIVDRFLYAIVGIFVDMSPSVLVLAVGAGYLANRYWTSSASSTEEGTSSGSSYNDGYYDYYYDRPYYSWRHWHYWGGWGYWGWWYGASGIFSVLVVGFFVWQFGTKNGETDFSWTHVKRRVQRMDFWEVMRYGALLEGAILFFMRMAQGGGGVRRRR